MKGDWPMAMWLVRAKEDGMCVRCNEPYKRREAVGVISLRTTLGCIVHHAHPQCWLELGLEAIGETKTGDRPVLDENSAKERAWLVRNWATLNYREKSYRKVLSGDELDATIANLDKMRDEIRTKISEYGGVPEKWGRTGH